MEENQARRIDTYYLHGIFLPLYQAGDLEDVREDYQKIDPNLDHRVVEMLAADILPAFQEWDEEDRRGAQLALSYYLTLSERDPALGHEIFDAQLGHYNLPIRDPENPRDLFLCTWEVLFPGEDYHLEDPGTCVEKPQTKTLQRLVKHQSTERDVLAKYDEAEPVYSMRLREMDEKLIVHTVQRFGCIVAKGALRKRALSGELPDRPSLRREPRDAAKFTSFSEQAQVMKDAEAARRRTPNLRKGIGRYPKAIGEGFYRNCAGGREYPTNLVFFRYDRRGMLRQILPLLREPRPDFLTRARMPESQSGCLTGWLKAIGRRR